MAPQRSIFVTLQKEGIHCYPDALTNPKLAEVSFLGHPHRHQFLIKVTVEVYHTDRDLEFIIEKRFIERLYSQDTLQLNHKSCEMISDDLYAILLERYKEIPRDVTIEVSEDGENGSITMYPKSCMISSEQ